MRGREIAIKFQNPKPLLSEEELVTVGRQTADVGEREESKERAQAERRASVLSAGEIMAAQNRELNRMKEENNAVAVPPVVQWEDIWTRETTVEGQVRGAM